MSGRTLQEDSVYYRLEYARIARLLESTRRHGKVRSWRARFDPSDIEPTIPPLRLSLSAAAKETIDAVIGELTPEQKALSNGPRPVPPEKPQSESLNLDASNLATTASEELWRLRWHWVGRQPPWYVRLPGLPGRRHWHRRREYLVLAEFLDRVLEPAAIILHFSCRITEGQMNDPDWILEGPKESPWPLKRPSRRQWRNSPEDELHHWLRKYLLELVKRATPKPPSKDPELRHRGWRRWLPSLLLDSLQNLYGWLGVVCHHPTEDPHYRVRYNLACLFARASTRAADRGKFLRAAEEQLQLALKALHGTRRAALAEWAWRDPGLAALRDAEDYGLKEILPPPESRS